MVDSVSVPGGAEGEGNRGGLVALAQRCEPFPLGRPRDAVRFAATELVRELLQTADNLSRALQSVMPGAPDQDEVLKNLLGGVAASERALQDTFAKHGIRRIQPALGEPFDPTQHQAMFEVEGSGCEPGTIAQVVLPGYAYHERLLRPAFVGVARQSPAQQGSGQPA